MGFQRQNQAMRRHFVIFLLVLLFLFLYTGLQFLKMMPDSQGLAWILAFVFFLLTWFWQFAYRLVKNPYGSQSLYLFGWVGSLCLGLWGTFLIFAIPLDLLSVGSHLVGAAIGSEWIAPSTEVELSQKATQFIFTLSVGLTALGWLNVQKGPKVKKISIPLSEKSHALEGLKIALISDLHVGPTIRKAYVERTVNRALEAKPDLIAITGDLADGAPEDLKEYLEPLRRLQAPLGVFYVTGNHEYYWGGLRWVEKIKELGFIPLLNENQVLSFKGSSLLVGGVTDLSGGQFIPGHRSDPKKASETETNPSFKLLLAHQPGSALAAEKAGFDLQLSGHTHAGQFFPWNLFVKYAHRYYQGLNRHGNLWVYVSPGTGYWGPAHRFWVPAEVTLLEFEKN